MTTKSEIGIMGITPAYAGKSRRGSAGCFLHRDHPRLCGEKSSMYVLVIPSAGSPPPMRGKARANLGYGNKIGITPAYAGKRAAL